MRVCGRTAYRTFLSFTQIFGVSRRARQSQGIFGMLNVRFGFRPRLLRRLVCEIGGLDLFT